MNTFDLGQNDGVKLKGCPFCGGNARMLGGDSVNYSYIQCEACHCETVVHDNEAGSIAAWNRRHDETPSEFERLCGKENSHV